MADKKAKIRLRIEKLKVTLKRIELELKAKAQRQGAASRDGRSVSDLRQKLDKAEELVRRAERSVDNPAAVDNPEDILDLADPIMDELEPVLDAGASGGQEVEDDASDQDEPRGAGDGDDIMDAVDEARDWQKRMKKRQEARTKKAQSRTSTKKQTVKGTPKPAAVRGLPAAPRLGGLRIGGGAGGAGGALRMGLGAALKHPYVLAALAIIAVIVGVVMLIVAGGQNKTFSKIGGSAFQAMDYDDPVMQQRVARLAGLVTGDDPVIEFANGADSRDLLEWKVAEGGEYYSVADARLVQTVEYLVDRGWEKIVIGLTRSNGPEKTRRIGVGKTNSGQQIDALSAYGTGQAIGIVALGKTSPGLTQCLELPAPIPVQIGWQETIEEKVLPYTYESLNVNIGLLYAEYQLHRLSAGDRLISQQGQESGDGRPVSAEAREALRAIREDLERVIATGARVNLNDNTLNYANQALSLLAGVSADNLLASEPALRGGMQLALRMMQVANVDGWEGSRDDDCKLWKASEARQNNRKLVLDISVMPVVLAATTADDVVGFDPSLAVKQLIVYSPEDDLDNGLPDIDVFPVGAVAVDIGGVGYDATRRDNAIDAADNHFMALSQSNGILAKASGIFVEDNLGVETEEGNPELALADEARNRLHEIGDGDYESVGRVTYKNFAHIAF